MKVESGVGIRMSDTKCWCGGEPSHRYSYCGLGANTIRELKDHVRQMGVDWYREMVEDHKYCTKEKDGYE